MYVCPSASKLLSAGSDRCVPDCQEASRLKSLFSFFFSFFTETVFIPIKASSPGRGGRGEKVTGGREAAIACQEVTGGGEEVIHISTPSSAVHYFLFHPCNSGRMGQSREGAGSALVKNGSHYELDPCRH